MLNAPRNPTASLQRKALVWVLTALLAPVAPVLAQAERALGADDVPVAVEQNVRPLDHILRSDGTLDLSNGFRGSLSPEGYRMVTGPDGAPRFVRGEARANESLGAPAIGAPGGVALAAGLAPDGVWETGWGDLTLQSDATVLAVAVDGAGNLYVGGSFATIGNLQVNGIAKWSGSTWSALGVGVSGIVNALAIDGRGNLYVGGHFTTAGGSAASNIAKWNGSAWSAMGNGVDNSVQALAVDRAGSVYAGGYFTIAGGVLANYIAKWTGSQWSGLGGGRTIT